MTARQVVIHRPGGYERLTREPLAIPVPKAGEVLVATEAIGVNYADCVIRMGLYASAKEFVGWPITPGFELQGAKVFGVTLFGGYSTHVVVPRHQLFPLPAHLASLGKLVIYGFHSMLPRQGGWPSWLKLAWDWLRTPRYNPLTLTNDNTSVLAFNLSYLFEQRDILSSAMARMLAWVEEGKLVAPPVSRFPLDQVADAHRALESGTTVGKLVLVP
ncbi:zinc-binding dehydrogenase [Hyalangium gracile]|uniref:zinc-binding dehydrogenase n=1 Tax=Hyalangium gracile TaxID=394092 RepID=UPI001CCE35F9|nr:zinc-binding dehydrogenase [Hyalangium gracile]